MPAKASAFRQNMEQLFAQNNISPSVLCETSQSDLVIQLASQGLAVGFASRSIARKLQNPLCCILPLNPRISRPIYYVTAHPLLYFIRRKSSSLYKSICRKIVYVPELLFRFFSKYFPDYQKYCNHQHDSCRKRDPGCLYKSGDNVYNKGNCCNCECVRKLSRYMVHMIALCTR